MQKRIDGRKKYKADTRQCLTLQDRFHKRTRYTVSTTLGHVTVSVWPISYLLSWSTLSLHVTNHKEVITDDELQDQQQARLRLN